MVRRRLLSVGPLDTLDQTSLLRGCPLLCRALSVPAASASAHDAGSTACLVPLPQGRARQECLQTRCVSLSRGLWRGVMAGPSLCLGTGLVL